MAAKTILGALVARFEDDGLLAGLVGLTTAGQVKVFVGQEPEDDDLPFVVLVHQGEVPEWSFESAYTEVGKVQFACMAKGCANAEEIALRVKAVFDWCQASLTIVNATVVRVMRTNYQVTAEEMKAPDGSIVYQAMVEYETEVKRVLP